ncbi:MAG: flagellar hook assembly protein FlgD [Pseudomonadota bacterium]
MNTIDNPFAAFKPTPPSPTRDNNELGSEDYLTLMVAQIQNQDPFSPMENGAFVAELAQFSTVSGIEELNQNFASLATSLSSDQTLQASGLIGRDVLMNNPTGYLEAGSTLGGAVDLAAAAGEVTVEVRDQAGALVRRISLGDRGAGLTRFEWDGRNADGEPMPAGQYTFSASGEINGQSQAATTLARARVNSVSLDAQGAGLTINFSGLDALPLSQVREIS